MHEPPGTKPAPLIVLSVSPIEEDDRCLKEIASHSKWLVLKARDLLTAFGILRRHEISVILCERDLKPGTWIDMLEHIDDLPHPPSLIVTSRLADDRLWAEALQLGAWDVLAKPFDRQEAMRSVKLAWQHWYHKAEMATARKTAIRAAS